MSILLVLHLCISFPAKYSTTCIFGQVLYKDLILDISSRVLQGEKRKREKTCEVLVKSLECSARSALSKELEELEELFSTIFNNPAN